MRKLILLFAISVLINGCSKDNNQSAEIPNESTEITVESINVKSFELVTLTIQNSELLDTYQGKFGNIEVIINKVNENSLAFLVPDISQGSHNLNFDLGNKDFSVTETLVSNPQETINNVFTDFNTGISNLDNTNPYINGEIQNAMSYFSEVQDLYNSLTDEQKIQVALYYEANKETFQRFVNNTNLNIDASTVLSRVPQSQCTTTDFKSFYGCTAENLGESSAELTQSTIEVLTMLGLAGTAIVISPATVGISLGTAGIAVATAVYILIAETVPALIHFKSSTQQFLQANWIFTQATFSTIASEFTSDTETDLNSQPTFRSLNENDEDISTETSFFISSLNTLNGYWNSLSALFPSMPSYESSTEIIEFDETSDQVNITNITNSNVELVSVTGQNAKFKSLSSEDETFSFDMEIIKEGFSLNETIDNVSVLAESQELTGIWNMNGDSVSCQNNPTFGNSTIEFFANGSLSWQGVISGTYTFINNELEFTISNSFTHNYNCTDGSTLSSNYLSEGDYNGTFDGTSFNGFYFSVETYTPNLSSCQGDSNESCQGPMIISQ